MKIKIYINKIRNNERHKKCIFDKITFKYILKLFDSCIICHFLFNKKNYKCQINSYFKNLTFSKGSKKISTVFGY